MSGRLRVVLTTEGTYPHNTGGVSTWADILVKRLEDIDFHIMPIMMHPYISVKFDMPLNVVDVVSVPLWGTEEPTEYISGMPFHKLYLRKLKTGSQAAEKKFLKILDTVIRSLYSGCQDMGLLGETLVEFHDFFYKYDYHETFRSQTVWDYFYGLMQDIYAAGEEEPVIYNFVESLRWLYRFFITLLVPVIRADVYHSSAAAFCGLPCIVAKIKTGAKYLLTEHGIYIREQYLYASREKMPSLAKDFLLRLITSVAKLNYHYADQISPVCAYNKRWELKFGAREEKIKVIHNGIALDRFRRLDVPRDIRPTVVMVARIDALKDIETFIRTCHEVKMKRKGVLFKLFGPVVDDKYHEKCSRLVKELGVSDCFVFAGKTGSPELANNEGDIVLLTSISEAFPFSVIEGMACEKVVVSSDVGGTKEVLEGYGFVVRPRDPSSFAEKILYILDNPEEAAELGIEARQRVLGGYMIDDMVNNYRRAYYSLLDGNGGGDGKPGGF